MSQLRRIIGVRALALTMVNLAVGAGIFGLPALAARELGVGAVFAYLVCILLVGLVGLCLAEVGSRVSDAGGVYGYATASFGPFAGTVTGQLWFANGAVGNAAVAALLADTLGVLLPWLAAPLPRAVVLLGYYAALAAINARAAFGPIGGTIMLVAALLSTAGAIAADALATPRVMHALGRDGALPKALGRVDGARATPAIAIVVYAVVCAALALSGTFRVLATLSASGTLCIYLVCCTGLLRLRARGVREEREPFVVPGGPVVPILAAITVVGVLSGLERRDFIMLGGMLGVTVTVAFLRRRATRIGA